MLRQAASKTFLPFRPCQVKWNKRFYSTLHSIEGKESSGILKYVLLGGFLGGSSYYILSSGAPNPTEIANGDSVNSFFANFKRIFSRCRSSLTEYNEPAFEKLLPDPYTGPEAKPYTLVIDLDGFLVCHQWDPINSRWKVAKRPGADIFLYYMAHLYEVVLYSSLSQFEAEPILEKLDPMQFITYRLYRFATKFKDGKYLKDLTKINRDLSKVVVFGHDPSFAKFKENFIQTERWNGNPEDKILEKSIDFLEALAFSSVKDLRPVIKSYEGGNILEAFDEKQRDLYESMRQDRISSNSSWFKRLFVNLFIPDLAKANTNEMDSKPYEERKELLMEQRRKDFAIDYERIKKEYQKQVEANKEYLASNKMPLFDLVTKGPPPPPPELIASAAAQATKLEN